MCYWMHIKLCSLLKPTEFSSLHFYFLITIFINTKACAFAGENFSLCKTKIVLRRLFLHWNKWTPSSWGSNSIFDTLLAMWSWASKLISLCNSYFICKMGILIASSLKSWYKDKMNKYVTWLEQCLKHSRFY